MCRSADGLGANRPAPAAPLASVTPAESNAGADEMSPALANCGRRCKDGMVQLPVSPPVAPMLAKAATTVPTDAGVWSYEPKWDGFLH
ncbi:hypothetical protein MFAL_29610 [Mycolicibacterium fallax]|nr:hypothetical protein MFAL_29610 [Mycolicibacterium fallax]